MGGIVEGEFTVQNKLTPRFQVPNPISLIFYELYISWQFMRYDLTATVLPASLFMFASAIKYDPSALGIYLLKSILYFWLYIYTFNLSNQYVGFKEDGLNKPNRPIPSGLVTMPGTVFRWWVFTVLYLVVAFLLGVFHWAVSWTIIVILHNWLRWSWHWLGKNTLMGLGTFVQLAAAWEIVRPLDSLGWTWVIMMAVVIFFIVAIQDLRDIEGDAALGRRTMPMVFGLNPSRWYFALAMLTVPLIIYYVSIPPGKLSPLALLHYLFISAMCFIISIRLVLRRSNHADRVTYDWLTSWYSVTLPFIIWLI
jgi:4-hydroxybenzoate polyprenyltransferase